MEHEQTIPLTSVELTGMHQTYISDSMAGCVYSHFLETVKDPEIKMVVEHALDISKQRVERIKGIFTEENIPVPIGFTEQDVNLEAPRLFSDKFYLTYINQMAKGGLSNFGFLLPQMFRNDVLTFFSKCLSSTIELNTEATLLSLEKGLAIRPPTIPYPEKVEFVHKQSFLVGFFAEKRPLTGMEISSLYANIQTNNLGEAMAIAFGQVAESDKIREYILRGKQISEKHINIFSSLLRAEELPAPQTWEQEVTDSTEAPLSEKLIMFHFGMMNFSGISNYGRALSTSQRSDLATAYSRLTAEILKFAEDGTNIMINEGWMEQQPMAADRDDLIKGSLKEAEPAR